MCNTLHLQLKNKQEQEQVEESDELQTIPENFTCEICIEPNILSKKSRNSDVCSHPYCTDCMVSYIQMKLEQNVANIPCPCPNCPHNLDVDFFGPLLPPRVFVKWCDVLCDSTVLGLERCYCPYRDCSALVVNECGGRVKKEKCPNCKRLFCFQCKKQWHDGFRCGVLVDENDVAFNALAQQRKWKRCPRCLHFVERSSGCNSVKCRCGTRFCYGCGRRICRCIISGRCCSSFVVAIVLLNVAIVAIFILAKFFL